jgi:hypothetical protein
MADERVCTGVFVLAVALGCLISSSQGVTLNLQNQCTDTITVYWRQGTQQTANTAAVPSQGQHALDVGATWQAGIVWAANPNTALATVAEFTIGDNGMDTYDISLVNAYNLGIEIQPVTPSGATCDDIKCTIAGLQGFCGQGTDNKYTPAGTGTAESCTNTDGPQPATNAECCCSTANTQKFKGACPDAYSFSKDDKSSTFNCVGDSTDYNIIFCPAGNSSNHNMPCPQS